MPWHVTTDLDEFDDSAGPFLRARPTENTLLLTMVDNIRKRGARAYGDEDPVYGWWETLGGSVRGAYLRTPPFPALLADVPREALESLVDIMAGVGQFNAERGLAEAVAERWLRRTGAPVATGVRIGRETRLYRLDGLVPPDPAPPGHARLAAPADRRLLISWYEMFGEEVGDEHADVLAVIDDRISYGGLVLWEDGGVPVSMAGRSRPQAGTVRIGPVFTPVERRRRGYAGAVTADISQRALDLGAEVVLFTDLANPTSNTIYQRLGYRAIEDRVVISLGAPGA